MSSVMCELAKSCLTDEGVTTPQLCQLLALFTGPSYHLLVSCEKGPDSRSLMSNCCSYCCTNTALCVTTQQTRCCKSDSISLNIQKGGGAI